MGESMPYEFVLPERTFTKPLAKAVVEQRKKLVRDPNAPRGVANGARCADARRRRVIDDSRCIWPCATPIGGCAPIMSREAIA